MTGSTRRTGSGRAIGAAFAPATFLAEAIGTYQLRLHYPQQERLYLLLGLMLLGVSMVSGPRRPLSNALWTVLLTAVGIVIYGSLAGITTV